VINHGRVMNVPRLRDLPGTRSRYVLNMIECSSMLGIPIPVIGEPEYGLFVFRVDQEPFSSSESQSIEHVIWEAQVTLERAANMEMVARDHMRLAVATLFSGMAHETGNAINSMVLHLQPMEKYIARLREGQLSSSDQQELAKAMKVIGERGGMIANLLKSFLGSMSERPDAPGELFLLLHEAVESLKPQAKLVGVDLQCFAEGSLSRVKYPHLAIRQGLFNLVLNAIQHLQLSPARKKRVEVRAGMQDKVLPVWISVSDTGDGVHEGLRERIFDPYFTTRKEGSGMGLYLTRWFVESLGGQVFVHRTVRFEGTEFRIELPRPQNACSSATVGA
jgi:two-component system, sporulation sensor kinase E